MTAINALATPTAAYVLSDTALYYEDGIVGGFGSKVMAVPHLSLAFGTSGKRGQSVQVAEVLEQFSSFEDVIEKLAAALREHWDGGHFEQMGPEDGDHFRLIIAGWSTTRGRAEVYATSTDHDRTDGGEPFTLTQAPVVFTPSFHMEVLHVWGLMVNGNITGASPERWLLDLIELQRGRRMDARGEVASASLDGPNEGMFIVGGAAVLTRINSAGITQSVLRRWNDKAGEMINPEGHHG